MLLVGPIQNSMAGVQLRLYMMLSRSLGCSKKVLGACRFAKAKRIGASTRRDFGQCGGTY